MLNHLSNLGNKDFLYALGVPQRFTTIDELIKFVTMVVFTGSVQHAAVNSGQVNTWLLVFYDLYWVNSQLKLSPICNASTWDFLHGTKQSQFKVKQSCSNCFWGKYFIFSFCCSMTMVAGCQTLPSPCNFPHQLKRGKQLRPLCWTHSQMSMQQFRAWPPCGCSAKSPMTL